MMVKGIGSFNKAEESCLIAKTVSNPSSPKQSTVFDLKDLKKKLLSSENVKKTVKERGIVNIPSIQERTLEHEPSTLIKHISPKHSKSPNGSGSGSTLAKLANSQYISIDLKAPGSAKKKSTMTSLSKITNSPKGAVSPTTALTENKAKGGESLTTSVNLGVGKKKIITNSSISYQKKIDSILKRK